MPDASIRFGPMVAVVGLVGYCLMPYLSSSPMEKPSSPMEKPPRIESTLLSPRLESSLQRNPFESVPEPSKPGAKGEQSRPGGPADPDERPSLPEGLYLGATLVHGRRHAAVINGRVYSEGEEIRPPEVAPAPGAGPAPEAAADPVSAEPAPRPARMVLARVEHDRVWVDLQPQEGQAVRLTLAYAPRPRSDRSQDGAKAPAGPAMASISEPGSLEHLNAIAGADSMQMQLVSALAQRLLGRTLPALQPTTTSPTARGRAPR
jgi:hypothetical protein